jgi:diguanylate cyclase (GGDEF)-like protein
MRKIPDGRGANGPIPPGMSAIRDYFARRPDPYAGGDFENAQRLGAVLFALQVALVALLLPLSPPTHAFGALGWVAAAAVELGGAIVVVRMRRKRFRNWTELLAISYAAVAALVIAEWLGGGVETPYDRAILLPVMFVAAIQPPRRIAGFLGFVGLGMVAPFLYDGWNQQAAGASAASLVILSGLSVGLNLMMSGIRAQRLAHARDEAAAREEARVDSLTGLRNRRAFDEALAADVTLARRLEVPLSAVMVDVVNFKEINDLWSPAEGDRCLRDVAEALRSAVRDPDHLFRWGGDEFVLILRGTPIGGAQALCERLRDEVSSSCQRPDEAPVEIRFAVADLHDDETPEELVEMMGVAMASTKLQGGRLERPPHTTNATSST